MGTYDVPAFIEKIKKTTGQQKVNYIGFSEGCTQILAGASLKPKWYKDNVKLAILLAPPAAMEHVKIPMHWLFKWRWQRNMVKKTLDGLKFYNVAPVKNKDRLEEAKKCKKLLNGAWC